MAAITSFDALTPAELKRSAIAESQGLHAGLKWQQILGSKADSTLSQRVKIEHPALYRKLKLEWQYATGVTKRPTATPTDSYDF